MRLTSSVVYFLGYSNYSRYLETVALKTAFKKYNQGGSFRDSLWA